MADDVLITPASGIIEFKDVGTTRAQIQLDASNNLVISTTTGNVSVGTPGSNVYIGDGTNSVDVLFEQNGSVRALAGKTLTIGGTGSVTVTSPTISGGTINNAIIGGTTPAAITGTTVTATGNLISSNSAGDEGGEILLAKPQTNSTFSGTGVTIDVWQNRLRIFEQGGSARGVYVDLTAAAAGVGTNLLAPAGSTTANALTIGTGLSGTSFNGSAAVTIALATAYGDTLNPYGSKTANFVLAAPNGTAGVPTFRALVAADVPTLNQNTTGTASNVTGTVAVANGGTGATSAAQALTNLGAYAASNPSGYTTNTGTVTSVGGTGTVNGLTLTGTVTASGNLTLGGTLSVSGNDFGSRIANTFLAAPNGTAGNPTFRALVAADVPTLNQNTTGTASNVTGTVAIANGGTGATDASTALTNLGAYAASNPSGYTTNTGTVTSVGGTGTVSGLTLTGTVTTTGNLTLGGTLSVAASNFSSQTANTVLIAPNGTAGVPTFRALVAADIPTLNQNTTGTASNVTGTVAVANGGTGATSAGTARTNLGATTAGGNLFTLTNPSAVTFLRVNADNTVSALNASDFRTAIGVTTGSGTVTSVGLSLPAMFTVTNSPVTTSGTLTATLASQTANTVFAAPSGSAGSPTFRALVAADIPALTLENLPDAWIKRAVKVATTANITLSGTQTIDGISVVAGDRVLVKNQSTTSQNGIYVVAAGAWTRSTDADSASEIAGAHVSVDQGTAGGGLVYDTDFKSTDTLGTTGMTWARSVDTGYFTTVGNNLVTLTNPSAITFPRFNADNTVSALDAATFRTAISAGDVTTTGTQTLTNKTVSSLILNDGYTEEVFAITDGTTVNLNPNNGSIQTWTLGASRTPGQASWNAGQSITLLIDDGTGFTITWTTLGVQWKTNTGTAPTLNTTGFTVIVLWKVGTQIYGARVGDS